MKTISIVNLVLLILFGAVGVFFYSHMSQMEKDVADLKEGLSCQYLTTDLSKTRMLQLERKLADLNNSQLAQRSASDFLEARVLKLEKATTDLKDEQDCQKAVNILKSTADASLNQQSGSGNGTVTKTVYTAMKGGHVAIAETKVEHAKEPNCQMCIACPGWRFGTVKNGRAFCDSCNHMSDMHPLAKKMFCVLDACTCEGWKRGDRDPSGFYKCANCGHLEGCHNK